MNATARSMFALLTRSATTHRPITRRYCVCLTAHTPPYTASFKIGVPA